MHLHVSPRANVPSASDWMKHHKAPPPHHHIIFHMTLPSQPRVGLRYKNRRVRPHRNVLIWVSQPAPVCFHPSTPGRHFVTFSLMNSQMILVISSPSISTTGWATLMRLSASVRSHMQKGSSRDRLSFTAECEFIYGSMTAGGHTQEATVIGGYLQRFCYLSPLHLPANICPLGCILQSFPLSINLPFILPFTL